MSRYRLDILASLARQMAFTPAHVRERQLTAAEELALNIEPAKAYPPAYVIFCITGYKPRGSPTAMLTGLALQHDLGLLIEEVSAGLGQHTADRSEPVLSIDDVVAGFNVTSKTVQRWRRRGLVARRFIFPDGKRRVGFRLTVVERFLAAHRSQVLHSGNLSDISSAERQAILRHARRLAGACGCAGDEVARRIARRLGRSPLTIESCLRKHDAESPASAVLTMAPERLSDVQMRVVRSALDNGMSLANAAAQIGRRASAVYRLQLQARLERLTERPMRFIDDPLYHAEGAESQLNVLLRADIVEPPSREMSRVPADLPPYLRDLYRTPLLSPARERALFLKFNYEKFQFVTVRRRLDPALARVRDVVLLERLLAKLQATKNSIVQANLRLVVSVAKKHVRAGVDLMELVSEGNLTLMRAVEGFDVHKGNKFSTYATLALMKGFARSVGQLTTGDKTLSTEAADRIAGGECVCDTVERRDQVRNLLSRLSDDERWVLCDRYDLVLPEGNAPAMPSAARAKLLERSAIEKLRAMPA